MRVIDDYGKEFERAVQRSLEFYASKLKLAFVRLYDTTSARGMFLPAQPGDFTGVVRQGRHTGQAFLLECKASAEHTSLIDNIDLVSKEQGASLRLWAQMNALSLVLFWSASSNRVEVWSGLTVGRMVGRLEKIGTQAPILIGKQQHLDSVIHEALLIA